METIEKKLGRNALAVKCSFGGGDSRCLGIVYNNPRFKAKSGHNWMVPLLQGAFPIFPNDATLTQKKQLISEFIEREKDRKSVKTCKEILKRMLMDFLNENFVLQNFTKYIPHRANQWW